VAYDRTTRGSTAELAVNPPAVRREVMLPFSVQFMGGLWSEPTLLEIAAAYEAARGPRMPPPDFGPIAGEP
jgi:Asp-tRNA(Asn)/Glu-tRNA(Gln) amidotransferase A subunit family amidase